MGRPVHGGGALRAAIQIVVPIETAEGRVFLARDGVEGVGQAAGDFGVGRGRAGAKRGDRGGVGVLQPIQAFGTGGTQGFAGGAGGGGIRAQGGVHRVGFGERAFVVGPRQARGGEEDGGERCGEDGCQMVKTLHGGASGKGDEHKNDEYRIASGPPGLGNAQVTTRREGQSDWPADPGLKRYLRSLAARYRAGAASP